MTKTTAILLCCLLTLACTENNYYMPGDDGGSGPGGSTSATSAGGSDGGSGGSVGEGGQGGATTAVAGGAGGIGGGGGDGGMGGMAPICPPAPCPMPSDGDLVINCDPACGAVSPQCAQACVSSIPIPVGLTVIRTPPISEQLPECEALCGAGGAMWAMAFEGPANVAGCFSVEGPDGGLSGQTGPEMWMSCHDNAPQCVTTGQINQLPVRSFVAVHPQQFTQQQEPDGGAVFRIQMNAAPCGQAPMPCAGGCNGAGL